MRATGDCVLQELHTLPSTIINFTTKSAQVLHQRRKRTVINAHLVHEHVCRSLKMQAIGEFVLAKKHKYA